ncbi:MAG: ABC transporter ATP-binding protein [Chloroflexi bacterium]|nr:ABC transporter ATP-binding protein [Chloroflexota bacterium]MCI0576570.1 ABC transporter ATP-binding protein [Chloroflexota bacterium]MCI0643799.1 ABC transporter ATP-binding protein [Chloroflexota bacterium]MCI0726912.1 ABC transporter ATP-binding protein [Chloroflexota bacterium]
MEIAIETHHLSKTFPRPGGWRRLARREGTTAVKDVNLTVYRGELFGLLGPNGAGKTTLVKTLCTLILPTHGTATIAGYSLAQPGKIREVVGLVVSDERSFYWRLSGRKNLTFFAAMYGLHGATAEERVHEALAEVDLLEHADKRFSNYSTGMRQRLAIARSLLHQPQVLFLDEPSRSLDPNATLRLHELIQGLMARRQVTVFLITHDLLEAEKLCQRVAVMHRGRIQVVGRPAELRRQLKPQLHYAVRVDGFDEAAAGALRSLLPDLRCEPAGAHQRLYFQAGEEDGTLMAALDCLRQQGAQVYSVEGHPASLEEVFAHYTGNVLEGGD